METKIPDILIDRAVLLWQRALIGGEWDNGDAQSRMIHSMFSRPDPDDFQDRVLKWGELLSARLKTLRDKDGEEMPEEEWFEYYKGNTETIYRVEHDLRTDYDPCRVMAWAAEQAGIPSRRFPAKSSTSFWMLDHVSASFGYGAKEENHYPLPDGRWLITDLRGPVDIQIIAAAVMDGRLPELRVEPAAIATEAEGRDGEAGSVHEGAGSEGTSP